MTKLEYYNKFLKRINEFLGAEIELEEVGNQIEFVPKFKSNFMKRTLEQIGSFFLVADLLLEKYYENNNSIYFTDLIEEFTQILISEMVSNKFEINEEQLNFIETLKEVCNETYENKDSALSVLVFKDKNKIENELEKLNLDYIPFESQKEIQEIFEDKLSLIMLNGENLILIVGENYKAYGIGVNRSKNTIIKDDMFKGFRRENNTYLVSYLELLSEKLLIHIEDAISELESKERINLDEEKISRLVHYSKKQIISSKNLYDTHNKKVVDMFPYIYMETSKRELKIYLKNSIDNFISYKNGRWRLKSYHVLKFLILDTFYMDSFIYSLFNERGKNRELTKNIVMNIDVLICLIKNLLYEGKGGLFLILKRTITSEELKKIYINDGEEKSIYEKIVLQKNKNVQLKDHNFEYLKLISKIDGAVTLDSSFNLLSFGKLIRLNVKGHKSDKTIQGARTAAALSASEYGLAIKVSEDGNITIWQNKGKKLEI
jgi:hypothetical protein